MPSRASKLPEPIASLRYSGWQIVLLNIMPCLPPPSSLLPLLPLPGLLDHVKSFRFGPDIAYVASCLLDVLKGVRRSTIVGSLQPG